MKAQTRELLNQAFDEVEGVEKDSYPSVRKVLIDDLDPVLTRFVELIAPENKPSGNMVTVDQFMKLIKYKVSGGSKYMWNCYGNNAYMLYCNDRAAALDNQLAIVFDTETLEVYEVEACDYSTDRAYRMQNDKYTEAYKIEARFRGVDLDEAWDDTKYINLEVVDDFLDKAQAIFAGECYDTRVQVNLELSMSEVRQLKMTAHMRGITLDQLVEEILIEATSAKASR